MEHGSDKMSWYKDCKLVKINGEYTAILYLNTEDTEFSREFIENIKGNPPEIDEKIKKIIQEKYPGIKVTAAKLVLGAVVVGSIPLLGTASHVKAAEITTASTATATQTASINVLNTTGEVLATVLNIRSGPGTTYTVITKLPQGTKVLVTGQTGDWYRVTLSDGRVGYASSPYIKLYAPTRQQKIDLLTSTATSLVGTPYVWGGASLADGGFDCSGFTKYVYSKVGYTLNRTSTEQALQGVYVAKTNIQPGDLLFYSFDGTGKISHVAIYLGNGKMIHSPKTGDTVKITDMTTSYWQTRYVTARRIIQ